MQLILLFSFYYPADTVALKLRESTMHKNVMKHLWKMPIGKFWGKFMPSAEKKYSVLETLFLVCLTLVETEGLTRGCPLFMQPELPIKSCVLSDVPNHAIRQGSGHPLSDENAIRGIKLV